VYDSIGLHECLSRILKMLLQNEDYILSPIEATWSKQQDKQRKNKKACESTPRCKGMRCAKRKAKLELERINNKRAKKKVISTNMAMLLNQQLKQVIMQLSMKMLLLSIHNQQQRNQL